MSTYNMSYTMQYLTLTYTSYLYYAISHLLYKKALKMTNFIDEKSEAQVMSFA